MFSIIKRSSVVCLFLLFAVISNFSTQSFAQMSEYDAAPRIRSYLQQPVGETNQYVDDVSVPRLTDDTGDPRMGMLPRQRLTDLPEMSEILIDKKIDPEKYIMGPGDLMNVYLWGELDHEYPLRVYPEGYVVIPTVGPVQVADITLADARKKILDKVHQKYEGIEVSSYLVEPRRFRVFISGVIENPGMYSAHSLLRVSDLLGEVIEIMSTDPQTEIRMSSRTAYERARGGLYARSEYMTRGEKKGSSKRSIIIERGDEEIEVDLLRFEKLGDLDNNPYVTGGDHIKVPPYMGDVMVTGEVNNGGIFELKSGDTIADLILFSGGLTAIADTSKASLVRFSSSGEDLEYKEINLYDAMYDNPDDPRYLLEESDRLFVQTKYNFKVLANVVIGGQVKFPGDYAILPHVTKLTEIIEMCGGFTEFANLAESRLVRQTTSALRDLEYERLRRMLVADMTDEEYEFFKHRSRISEGTISIDFVELFKNNDMSYDIVLEDGDNIFIPLERQLVSVLGAVQEPGFVKIAPGEELDYYIELAGGFNWNAKTRSIRIVKAKTGQRLKPGKDVPIEGGDTVHISEKKPIDYWQSFLDGTQLFANMATLVIIARNLSK